MMRRSLRTVSRILRLEPMKILKGKDFYGNEYFEVPAQKYFLGAREVVKLKRTIEPLNMEMYTRGGLEAGENVPTEWMAWLQWTRDDPPTTEEVENNIIRTQKIKEKVKLLEEKYNQEKPGLEQKPVKKDLEQADVESWTPK